MMWNHAVELLDVLFTKAAELDERDRQRIQEGERRCDAPVDFTGLNSRTCRWPLFEGHEPFYEKRYCGAPTISGGHYCAAHAGRAFTRRAFGQAKAVEVTPA
jgi:hypothetical protein